MPKKENKLSDDTEKTGILLAIANFCTLPLYYFWGKKQGLAASLAVTTVVLYQLNEQGKQERPVANAVNNGLGFWARLVGGSNSNNQIENTAQNIAAGGGSVFDWIFPPSKAPK